MGRTILGAVVGLVVAVVTIMLVEQNLKAAIGVASRFYIMSKGNIVFEGDREALENATDVRQKYLEV